VWCEVALHEILCQQGFWPPQSRHLTTHTLLKKKSPEPVGTFITSKKFQTYFFFLAAFFLAAFLFGAAFFFATFFFVAIFWNLMFSKMGYRQ
jgi:hypothetical protein